MTEDTNITPDVEQIAIDGFEPFAGLIAEGYTEEEIQDIIDNENPVLVDLFRQGFTEAEATEKATAILKEKRSAMTPEERAAYDAEIEEQEKNDPLYILTHKPDQLTPDTVKQLALAFSIFFTTWKSYVTDPEIIEREPKYKNIPPEIFKKLDVAIAGLQEIATGELTKETIDLYNKLKEESFSLINTENEQKNENTEQIAQLLEKDFILMLNNEATLTFSRMNAKKLLPNQRTKTATYQLGNNSIKVERYEIVGKNLGTSAKKLFDIAKCQLTKENYYRSLPVIRPSVIIDLMELWRAQGKDVDPADDSPQEIARANTMIKYLKRGTTADLTAIKAVSYQGYEKNNTQVCGYNFISGWRFLKGNRVKVNFDIDFASSLVYSWITQYPPILQRHDNRNPNNYPIGCRLAEHYAMDSNARAGTNGTLAVKTLLEYCPCIPDYESLMKSANKTWRKRIKGVLDDILDSQITIGYLASWIYRDTRTGKTYTKEEAAQLTWDEYYRLMVDYYPAIEPEQTARRAKRAAEIEARKAAASLPSPSEDKPKRKRGRPRKNPTPQPG